MSAFNVSMAELRSQQKYLHTTIHMYLTVMVVYRNLRLRPVADTYMPPYLPTISITNKWWVMARPYYCMYCLVFLKIDITILTRKSPDIEKCIDPGGYTLIHLLECKNM
jgi:hypothetical protein